MINIYTLKLCMETIEFVVIWRLFLLGTLMVRLEASSCYLFSSLRRRRRLSGNLSVEIIQLLQVERLPRVCKKTH